MRARVLLHSSRPLDAGGDTAARRPYHHGVHEFKSYLIGRSHRCAYYLRVKPVLPACLVSVWIAFQCVGIAEPNQTTRSLSSSLSDTNATAEFEKLQAADDAAQAEVDRWVREKNELKSTGSGVSQAELDKRIVERFEPIREGYEGFLSRHPADGRAHLVYGSFLNDRQNERGAQAQWERALELDPTNAVIYNNLAGRYSESGPVNKAFEFFAKAIELSPLEAGFYHNFGDSLYVLRKPATAYYGITEQQVYGRALLLYSNALRLDPQNYAFARDFAQTYYSLKPLPVNDALQAWTNALGIAHEEADREDACVHLARVKMLAGRFAEARSQLGAVTNETRLKAKANLLHNLEEREKAQHTTKNAP
jgi:Tfp pilus assembly protein PilF